MMKWVVLTLTFCAISCNKEPESIENTSVTETQKKFALTKLGKKLNNPFTVENMQKAYDKLQDNQTVHKKNWKNTIRGQKSITIQASHYYYRFLPKDSVEYVKLANDSILDIVNEPLDYEIIASGEGYLDPSLDASLPYGYQYSVFPISYDFPKEITHEKLEEMYFPLDQEDEFLAKSEKTVYRPLDKTSSTLRKNGKAFLSMLETEAIKITENFDDEELGSYQFIDAQGLKLNYTQIQENNWDINDFNIDYSDYQDRSLTARRWRPNGRITVLEDALSTSNRVVGVVGAEIKIRKWGFLVIKKTRTNAAGYFRSGSTRTKRVKYSVYFNSPTRFRINQGTVFVEARHRGTRRYKYGSWNQYFGSGRAHFYALIQNAAYDYYTKAVPRHRLSRPRRCEIKAVYKNDVASQHRAGMFCGIISDIRISRIRNGSYRGSDGIYATTVHELTHAGHRQLDPGMFSVFANSCRRDILIESWAEGVETILTNERFFSLDRNYKSTEPRDINEGTIKWGGWRQRRAVTDMNKYTPIVIDLIDDVNQNTLNNNFPIDNISGYTLGQIQAALVNSRFPDTWRNNLNRNRPTRVTTSELNTLFTYMNQVLTNPNACD